MSKIQFIPLPNHSNVQLKDLPIKSLPVEHAYVLPYNLNNEFFILRSSADRKHLVLAGGKRDISNSPNRDITIRDCAVREVREELGIDLSSATFSKLAIIHGGKNMWTARKAREHGYEVDGYIRKGEQFSVTHNRSVIFSCSVPSEIGIPNKHDGRKLYQIPFQDSLRDNRISKIVRKAIRHFLSER